MKQAVAGYQSKPFSPTSLALIIALHAAGIAGLAAWKIEVPDKRTFTPIKIIDIERVKPEPEPRKKPPVEQSKRVATVTKTDPIVDIVPIVRPPIGGDIVKPVEPPPPIPLPDVTPPPPVPIQSARAKGDVRTLITEADYPERARQRDESGAVRARLDIGPNGAVTGCSIILSSGFPLLDSATCKVLKSRARFAPARDAGGRTISDSYETPRIVWRLEGNG